MSILTNNFWLGDLSSFNNILNLEDMVLERKSKALEAGQKFDLYAPYDDDEDEVEREYQVVNGIAVIPVVGDLVTRETWLTRIFGMSSYEGIRRMLTNASEDAEVNRIIMDFNTPGGSSEGIDEVGLLINKIDKEIKPVHGYTSGSANSAGYWMISACRDVTCTKMASLGSIGVVTIHQEITKLLKDRGVEVTVFRDGEMKAKPNMYEKLDQKTIDNVNKSLAILGNFFLDWVAEQRGFARDSVRAAVGEGRVFFGQEAVQNGLADRIMFFDDFIDKLTKLDSINNPQPQYAGAPITVQFNGNITEEMINDNLIPALNDAINAGDEILFKSIKQTEDTDMSATTANKTGKTAGKTDKLIKTALGEITLEQAEAAVELGSLELTPELKADIAAAKAELNPEAEAEGDESSTEAEAKTGNSEAEMSSDDTDTTEGGDPVVAHVQSQLTEQISINAKLQLELETVKAKLSTQDDTVTALSQIAVNSCQKMNIALGGAQIDLSAMDVTTLLNHHNSLATQFTKIFKVGGVAAVETENENQPDADKPKAMSVPLSTVTFNK